MLGGAPQRAQGPLRDAQGVTVRGRGIDGQHHPDPPPTQKRAVLRLSILYMGLFVWRKVPTDLF